MMNNHFVVGQFVSDEESVAVKQFVDSLTHTNSKIDNQHIHEVHKELKGDSWIFDISNSEISNYLATFQSSNRLMDVVDLPSIFFNIKDRIADHLQLSDDNVFLQIIKQESGGRIKPHYDTGYPGYINYKCNIAIQSSEYELLIEKDKLIINQSDLYCFEASLYKHWTEPFKNERIILSYGFALKYEDLGRNEHDPRVRLSQRIVKYFQG